MPLNFSPPFTTPITANLTWVSTAPPGWLPNRMFSPLTCLLSHRWLTLTLYSTPSSIALITFLALVKFLLMSFWISLSNIMSTLHYLATLFMKEDRTNDGGWSHLTEGHSGRRNKMASTSNVHFAWSACVSKCMPGVAFKEEQEFLLMFTDRFSCLCQGPSPWWRHLNLLFLLWKHMH